MAPLELYWFDLDVEAEQRAAWRAWLAPEERARAERFVLPLHGERYIAAHGQLRGLLAAHTGGAPGALEFMEGAQGKPRLRGAGPHFNLSHSGHWGLVGLHPELELGVDLEGERPDMDGLGLARRFFTAREAAWLQAHPPHAQARAFTRLWTCKEAWLKADGRGLSLSLQRIEVDWDGGAAQLRALDAPGQPWWVRELELVPGMAAAVVAAGRDLAVTVARR